MQIRGPQVKNSNLQMKKSFSRVENSNLQMKKSFSQVEMSNLQVKKSFFRMETSNLQPAIMFLKEKTCYRAENIREKYFLGKLCLSKTGLLQESSFLPDSGLWLR